MASCPRAWSCVPHTEGEVAEVHLTVSALSARSGLPMTVRGGGVPAGTMAFMPSVRMGPPPRSFAADAHHCIMVRVSGPPNTRMLARSFVPPHAGSPRLRHPDHRKWKPSRSKAMMRRAWASTAKADQASARHGNGGGRQAPIEPACRRARACQGRALRVAAEERPALTHPARAGRIMLRSGRGKACGAVEQK